MATDFVLNAPLQVEYEYDFAVEGGSQGAINLGDATRNLAGDLPNGFVVTDAFFTVTTAFVGATATIQFGTTDDPNQYIADTAVTAFSANGVVGGAAQALTAVANDAASADVVMTISTADLTAGKGKLTLRGFVPSDKAGN